MNSSNNHNNNGSNNHNHDDDDSENENENENENETIAKKFYEQWIDVSILNFYSIHMYSIKLLHTCLVIFFER